MAPTISMPKRRRRAREAPAPPSRRKRLARTVRATTSPTRPRNLEYRGETKPGRDGPRAHSARARRFPVLVQEPAGPQPTASSPEHGHSRHKRCPPRPTRWPRCRGARYSRSERPAGAHGSLRIIEASADGYITRRADSGARQRQPQRRLPAKQRRVQRARLPWRLSATPTTITAPSSSW